MNRRALLTLFFFWLGAIVFSVHAEPKAYDLVKYVGKAEGVTLEFDFADGYPEASVMKVTEGGKTKTYGMQGTDKMQFMPLVGASPHPPGGPGMVGAIKSVSLNMSADDAAPAKVTGSMVNGGKTVPFTLTKKK